MFFKTMSFSTTRFIVFCIIPQSEFLTKLLRGRHVKQTKIKVRIFDIIQNN